MQRDMAEVGMNRPGSQPTVRGCMNNRLRTIRDITCCKDSWSTCSQGIRIDQQTAPWSDTNAGSLWQEGRVRRLTNGDKHTIYRDIEFGPQHRYWLAASLFIRFAQSHTLAAHAF